MLTLCEVIVDLRKFLELYLLRFNYGLGERERKKERKREREIA